MPADSRRAALGRCTPADSRRAALGRCTPADFGYRIQWGGAGPPISAAKPMRTRRFLPARAEQGMKSTGMYRFRWSRGNVRPRYTRWGAFVFCSDNANPQISTVPPLPMDENCASAPISRSKSTGLHGLRQGLGQDRRVCTGCDKVLAGIDGFARAEARRWMG